MDEEAFNKRFGRQLVEARLLAAARHQDHIRSWPWLARWLHKLLVSWRCPACRYWRERR